MDLDNDSNSELVALQKKVQTLTKEELDRDVSELSSEIKFLEVQVHADIDNYSPKELSIAQEKIAHFKRRLEIFNMELDKRG
jgi:hypothetical protein